MLTGSITGNDMILENFQKYNSKLNYKCRLTSNVQLQLNVSKSLKTIY